jgi:hypothetical protein
LSLHPQRIHGIEYQYFYFYEKHNGKTVHRSLSLGRKDRPNVANILKALSIIEERRLEYDQIRDQLIEMLPDKERQKQGET